LKDDRKVAAAKASTLIFLPRNDQLVRIRSLPDRREADVTQRSLDLRDLQLVQLALEERDRRRGRLGRSALFDGLFRGCRARLRRFRSDAAQESIPAQGGQRHVQPGGANAVDVEADRIPADDREVVPALSG